MGGSRREHDRCGRLLGLRLGPSVKVRFSKRAISGMGTFSRGWRNVSDTATGAGAFYGGNGNGMRISGTLWSGAFETFYCPHMPSSHL